MESFKVCLHLRIAMYPHHKCLVRLCTVWGEKMALLMRQRNSPGRIRQIKVNSVSEIAPVRSAVHSWVVHVQVERLEHRRRKSE